MLSLSSVLSVDLVCCWSVSLAVILEGEVCVFGCCVQGSVGVSLLLESTTSFCKESGIHCVVGKMVACEELVVAISLCDNL